MSDRNRGFLTLLTIASAIVTAVVALHGLTLETEKALESLKMSSVTLAIHLVSGLVWQPTIQNDLGPGEALKSTEIYGVLTLAAVGSVLVAYLAWNTI